MTSHEITVMKHGNQNPVIVNHIKTTFQKALRRNGSSQDVEKYLWKEFDVRSNKHLLGNVSMKLSSKKNRGVGIFFSVIGRNYSLVVNPVEVEDHKTRQARSRAGDYGSKFGEMHFFARYKPRSRPSSLLHASAENVADHMHYLGRMDKIDNLEIPKEMKLLVKKYV